MNCPICQRECKAVQQTASNHIRYHCYEHDVGFSCHTFDDNIFSFLLTNAKLNLYFIRKGGWNLSLTDRNGKMQDPFKQDKETISPEEAYQIFARYNNLLVFL